MPSKENPHAGQGAVVLDIGGDVGALVVRMPAWMTDLEVEIVPTGTTTPAHHHHEGTAHQHHDHQHHDHQHHVGTPPHVAVVPRSAPDGTIVHSLVFGSLREGSYDLYVRPDGPVQLTTLVVGGQVCETAWPETALLS